MYDEASKITQLHLGTDLVETSRSVGWTALLVERRRCCSAARDIWLRPTSDLHLVVQLDGRQQIESLSRGRWSMGQYEAGAVGMTASGEGPRLRSYCDKPFELAHLFLPLVTIEQAAEALRRAGRRAAPAALSALVVEDPLIAQTVYSLLRAVRAGAIDLYAQQAANWLATHLLLFHGGAQEPSRVSRADCLRDRRLARAVALARARFAEPLSLDALASEAGLSKFHFVRLFRQRVGVSPHGFIIAERMAAARKLLAQTDLQVSEVACRTGYAGVVQFSAAFRKHVGITPSAYRAQRSGFA